MLFKALIAQCNLVCLLQSVLSGVKMTCLCIYLIFNVKYINKEKSLIAHHTGSVRSGWVVLTSPGPHDCHVSRVCHEARDMCVTLAHVTSQVSQVTRAVVTGVMMMMLTSERITEH